MSFKSYCWCFGTTSFRVKQLNYKNELQLRYLSELFFENPNQKWRQLQEKYYNLLASKNFVNGKAKNKAKDARELTSGLADLGLVNRSNREVTAVGDYINKISKSGDFSSDNVLEISKDSYLYLLQFLKYQINDKDVKIRPFIALLYMLVNLKYLTRDEFTYLYPICMDVDDVIKITADIKLSRKRLSIDDLLIEKMMGMSNYKEAYKLFLSTDSITEQLIEKIGMNRKSSAYDKPFYGLFIALKQAILGKENYSIKEKVACVSEVKKALVKVNSNQRKAWVKLFGFSNNKKLNNKIIYDFYKVDLCQSTNLEDLKERFFKTWHLMKWKATLNDYYDLNKRYLDLTDVIKYENSTFKLTEMAEDYFKDVISQLLFKPLLIKPNYQVILTKNLAINEIYSECNKTKEDLHNIIKIKYGLELSARKLELYLKQIKNQNFLKIVNERFPEDTMLELMDCFKNRNEDRDVYDTRIKELVTENATASTSFEYILGIVWYRLSGEKGLLEECMNLSLDSNFMPKTHAPGGGADLIFKYKKTSYYMSHDVLLEATLSEKSGQRQMEWEPVSRHLENHIKATHNDRDYVIFIAGKLVGSTIKTFRLQKGYDFIDNGQNIVGLKIITLDADMIKKIIEKNIKYMDLYKIFDESYNSLENGMNWFNDTLKSELQ